MLHPPFSAPGEEPTASDLVDDLQARMNQVSASQRPKLDGDDLPPPVADSSKKPRGSEGSRGSTSTLDRPSFSAGSTFEEASNSDLASSLSARFAQLSRESASDSERESDRESDRESERDSDRDDTDDDPPVALASDASMDEVVEPLTGGCSADRETPSVFASRILPRHPQRESEELTG